MKGKPWTTEEDIIIRKYYPKEGGAGIAKRLPDRSDYAIRSRASRLGIRTDNPSYWFGRSDMWAKDEDDIIRKYYPTEGKLVAKRLPLRSENAVGLRAMKLGVRFITKKKTTVKVASQRWTKEEDDIIREYYPTYGSNVQSKIPNRSRDSIRSRARMLNVYKRAPYGAWTNHEVNIMKEYYPIEGLKVRARLKKDRSDAAIAHLAFRLGISKSRLYWTEKEDDIIRKYYPTEGKLVTKRLPHRSVGSIQKRAARLNVHWEKR